MFFVLFVNLYILRVLLGASDMTDVVAGAVLFYLALFNSKEKKCLRSLS